MSNPAANAQIGANGAARYYGIPSLAVQWTGNDGTTMFVATVFGNVEKDSSAVVQTGVDNANEVATMNRSQRKRTVKFSSKAQSTTSELAQAMAQQIPIQMDMVSIGHMTAGAFSVGGAGVIDAQLETASAIVDSCSARFTPEGELVIDFSLTVHLNPDGTIKTFAAVT